MASEAHTPSTGTCPTESAILAFIEGHPDSADVEAHLQTCDECRRVVSLLASPSEGTATSLVQSPRVPKTGPVVLGPGDVVAGKYEIVGEIGRGGMGVVLKALHRTLGQYVALKVLAFSLVGDALAVARFFREARAVAALGSEHVVRVLDADRLPSGEPFLVLEYLEGRDLGAELRARGPMPIAEAVDCALGACAALALAHRSQIVHRDIKPANLFRTIGVDGSVVVKVLDFGIAKILQGAAQSVDLTGRAAMIGSPRYMPPEQLRSSETVDARADVWALAVSLFELLTGRAPFEGTTVIEVCAAIATQSPTDLAVHRPDAPVALAAALSRALVKDREKRTPSVAAFAEAIAPYASGDGATLVARIRRIASPVTTRPLAADPNAGPSQSRLLAAGEASTLAVTPLATTPRAVTPLVPRPRTGGAGAAIVTVAVAASMVLAVLLGHGILSGRRAKGAIAPDSAAFKGAAVTLPTATGAVLSDPPIVFATSSEPSATGKAPESQMPPVPSDRITLSAPTALPSQTRSGEPRNKAQMARSATSPTPTIATSAPPRSADTAPAPTQTVSPLHREGLLDRK